MTNFVHKLVDATQHMPSALKHVVDGAAVTTAIGAFFDFLPNIAALLSVVWLSLQIYAWVDNRIKSKKPK